MNNNKLLKKYKSKTVTKTTTNKYKINNIK